MGKTFIQRILVQTPDQDAALRVQQTVRLLMPQRHRLQPNQDDDFRVGSSADLAQASQEIARVFTWLLGSIGIVNIMLVAVTERTREIGIRPTLGVRRNDILPQFLLEALVLSGADGVLGVFLGIAAALAIGTLSELPVSIVPWSVGLAFLFPGLVGVNFGLYPVRKAAGLRPVDALRYK